MRLKLVVQTTDEGVVRRENIKIINPDTGEMLRGVQAVSLSADVHGLPTLTVTTCTFDVDAELAATVRKQSLFGRLRCWWKRRRNIAAGRRSDRARLKTPGKCGNPPAGWKCTRGAGHDGPCAALPKNPFPA